MPDDARLARQLEFLLEIDKLKSISRRTWLTNGTRYENSAEHSWHLALMAVLLREYAASASIDIFRVVQMALVHDLVEIDAGDTYAYDEVGCLDQAERERVAADRIFGLLPADQAAEFRAVWEEFEARTTPEAQFAAALDRLQPILHNYHTQGRAWLEHDVTSERVLARNRHMEQGAPALWQYTQNLVADAIARGYLREK